MDAWFRLLSTVDVPLFTSYIAKLKYVLHYTTAIDNNRDKIVDALKK